MKLSSGKLSYLNNIWWAFGAIMYFLELKGQGGVWGGRGLQLGPDLILSAKEHSVLSSFDLRLYTVNAWPLDTNHLSEIDNLLYSILLSNFLQTVE